MNGTDPVLTLNLPRSVALTCLAALGNLPLVQVAQAYAALLAQVQQAEERAVMEAIAAKLSSPPTPDVADLGQWRADS